jgi:RNA polymerase sigma-70 factor (ECF subfamily)
MKALWCAAAIAIVAGAAVHAVRAQSSAQEKPKPTITSGKQVAEHTDIAGSVFTDVNLAGSQFENVNMSRTRMHDINLSDMDVSAANLGGAKFKHIGPPPDSSGSQPRQRGITFDEAQLGDSIFRKVDMSNVKIVDCNLKGMTIDGVLVTDLIAAHKNQKK